MSLFAAAGSPTPTPTSFILNDPFSASETSHGFWPWFKQAPLRIVLAVAVALVAIWLVRQIVRRVAVHMALGRVRLQAKAVQAVAAIPGVDIPVPDMSDERGRQRAHTIGSVLTSLFVLVIGIIAVGYILQQLGVNVALLVTSVGVAGIGIGLGMQSLWKDIFGGLFMLVEDQYGVGDHVNVGEVTGLVERVTLRVTIIRDDAGVQWFIPNGSIVRVANLDREKN